MATIYGFGAVMGFTPQQVDQMTLWEFDACAEGYTTAHGGGKKAEVSDADYEKLTALGDLWNSGVN